MTTQLTLAVSLKDNTTFENFFVGKNQATVTYLQEIAKGQGESFVFLCGAPASGKSHLLQASCYGALEINLQSAYISLKQFDQLSPQMLINLEMLPLVCLDDIDAIVGQAHWEEAIFHLYNRIIQQGSRLLISSQVPVANLKVQLADLLSRLSAALFLPLVHLNDDEKLMALQLRATKRGLHLAEEVGQYLLHRCPRDMQKLFAILERLDEASLIEQRKLTIPFVKSVLKL